MPGEFNTSRKHCRQEKLGEAGLNQRLDYLMCMDRRTRTGGGEVKKSVVPESNKRQTDAKSMIAQIPKGIDMKNLKSSIDSVLNRHYYAKQSRQRLMPRDIKLTVDKSKTILRSREESDIESNTYLGNGKIEDKHRFSIIVSLKSLKKPSYNKAYFKNQNVYW